MLLNKGMLTQLIYVSVPTEPVQTAVLDFIPVSKKTNDLLGITGLIVSDSTAYVQVLEGEQDDIDHVYAKIKSDTRHKNVELILYRSIQTRQFETWSMRYVALPKTITLESLTAEEKITVMYKTARIELRKKIMLTVLAGFMTLFAVTLGTLTFGPMIERAVLPPMYDLSGTVIQRTDNTAEILVTGNRHSDRHCKFSGIYASVFNKKEHQDSSIKILDVSPDQNARFVARVSVVYPQADQFETQVWSSCHALWDVQQQIEIK